MKLASFSDMKKTKPIQIITDISDISYNEIYGVMMGVAQKIGVVLDLAPVAAVKELSLINAAFLTRLLAETYTIPTVFYTQVSPLSKRPAIVAGETKTGHIFIGPNTGVFKWLTEDHGLKRLYEITVKKPYFQHGKLINLPIKKLSDAQKHSIGPEIKDCLLTFSAKSHIGPIAVNLAAGERFDKFGQAREANFLVGVKIIKGTVVHVDNFGIVKIKGKLSCPSGTQIEIYINGKKKTNAIYSTGRIWSNPDRTYILYPSTSFQGLTDLARVRCTGSQSAAGSLNINIGDVISFKTI